LPDSTSRHQDARRSQSAASNLVTVVAMLVIVLMRHQGAGAN